MSSSTVRPSRALSSIRGSAIRDLLRVTERPDVLSMAGGLPATDLIPSDRIAEAASRVISEASALQYTVSAGVRPLREVVADRDGTHPERVLITHGSQQALFLSAQALLDPGDTVIVDDPVYVGALQVFQSVRAEIVALPITAEGTDVDRLERLLSDGVRPRIVHTVSNFHNPAGVTASARTRRRLAELAADHGFWIIEDDPYGQLRFAGRSMDPIPGDRVIRLGSASKILAPALRVGWLQASPDVVELVELLRQGADLCGSTFAQLMTADLLGDSDFMTAHVSDLRREYARRAAALTGALRTDLGAVCGVEFIEPEGGMFCWLRLPGLDTAILLDHAVRAGVAFVPGAAFAVDAGLGDRLRLSFATLSPDQLTEAVRRLATAVHDLGRG
ncbi:aminotransferase-like domain-containing protein [Williamsia sterculiae]|uniref:aminotransferase-like domain-containing protein n=1 Tax=Williamsia sterculiae TaxID=1344003 RepID=UPI0009712030|nr:PLP-dependent aminotransferase family protein [Williamsia sterculiae]